MKLTIGIDGKQYEVEVDVPEQDSGPRPYPAYLPPSAPSATVLPSTTPPPVVAKCNGSGAVSDESKVCRSPIVGVVISVNVQEGQQLQPHDILLVLEAMKMETNVTAPVAGKIRAINVDLGDAVQKEQVLVEFE